MNIVLEGAREKIDAMRAFPTQFNNAMQNTMTRFLLIIWSKVPGYPTQQPTRSGYVRTGTLGRTLGAGSAQGADIYEVKQQGDFWSARFGTRLGYARYVIGDESSEQSDEMKRRGWWTLPQTVLEAALPEIEKTWKITIDEIGKFLEGKQNG